MPLYFGRMAGGEWPPCFVYTGGILPTVIDLGQYLRILLRWSWLIALLTILGLLAGLALRLTRPFTYESTALILSKPSPPNVSINTQSLEGIDPNIEQIIQPEYPVRTLAPLSNSLEVEDRVREAMGEVLSDDLRGPGALLQHVEVSEVRGRPLLLQVTATHKTAGMAQELADAWARTSVSYLNSLVGVDYLDPARANAQQEAARKAMDDSGVALNQFEKSSRLTSLSSQYAAQLRLLSDYGQRANQIELNLESASQLRTQLQSNSAPEAQTLPLALLALSSFTSQSSGVDVEEFLPNVSTGGAAANTQLGEDRQVPERREQQTAGYVVQPTLQELSQLTAREQLAFISGLTTVLTATQGRIQTRVDAVISNLNNLRSQLNEAGSERDRLVINYNANRQTYEQLRTLVREQQVEKGIQSEKITLAARAVKPHRTGLAGNMLLVFGGLAGAVLGTLLAFVLQFARNNRRPDRRGPSNSKVKTRDVTDHSHQDIVIGGN